MKTYKQLMEVMSMTDMNKIAGGTEAQRKIAQDRQRAREAKNKGFDSSKDVLADGGVKKPTNPTKASAAEDPLKKDSSSAIVKSTGLAKKETKTLPPSTGGSIVKSQPEPTKRKPDLRKSQLGKWSEGKKKSPSNLAKRKPDAITKPEKVEKVKVTDNGNEGQRGNRPGTTTTNNTTNNTTINNNAPTKPKKKPNFGKALKKLGSKAVGLAKKIKDSGESGDVNSYGEDQHSGLQGRNKGVGN